MHNPPFALSEISFRTQVLPLDPSAVAAIVKSTGFFSEEENAIAEELVEITLRQPQADEYLFIFADLAERVIGYSCYGRIPLTKSSYDMYWIAVDNEFRRAGLGKELLRRTEQGIVSHGGTQAYLDTSGREQYIPTRKFYEAAGYTAEAVLRDFYAPNDDKVIYKKILV
jgi:ribosomal protein S18 acetylase RimI-like enzyme